MVSTSKLVLFCACLVLFTSTNLVKAGHHHGGHGIRELLGGGLLTLLFARGHGHSSGSGGHHEGRSAAPVPNSHGIPVGLPQGQGRIPGVLPHGHGLGIPVPMQAFLGPAYAHGLIAPGFMHAHGPMVGLPQIHGLNPHGSMYGDVSGRSAAYNLGYMPGAVGTDQAFFGMQGLGMHGLENIYFGNILKNTFPMQGLVGHSLGSSGDGLIPSGFPISNVNSPQGGSNYYPIQNDASQKSAV